jgi:hypothetical protein
MGDDGDSHSSDEERPMPAEALKRGMSHSALAGMFGSSEPPAAAAAPRGVVSDLDDMFGGGGGAAAAPSAGAAVDPAQIAEMHRALITSGGGGKILETAEMQLAVQAPQFRLSQGRLQLLIGDKSGSGLSGVALTFAPTPAMRIAVQGLASAVPAGGQMKALLCVQAMAPFSDPPSCTVTYRSNATGAVVSATVKCPCFVGSFVTPLPLDGPNFKKRWMGLTGPREAVAILDMPGSGPREDMALLTRYVTERLHCAVVDGIDASPYVLSAVGTFQTGKDGANGKKVTVGTMLRLQANPKIGKVKFTVHSVAAGVSLGMVAAFTALLAK